MFKLLCLQISFLVLLVTFEKAIAQSENKPDKDLFVSLAHPANWNGQTGPKITENMIAYLRSICPARPIGNPAPEFVISCKLIDWMQEYLALDQTFHNSKSFQLVFEKGVNLKDVVTVNFTYDFVSDPMSNPFEALARFVILRKLIFKNLPQLATTIHTLNTSDGRNTWVFDSAIFPRLNAYFSGQSIISRMAAFDRGLVCKDREYVIPKCLEMKAKMKGTLQWLKLVLSRSRWDQELKNASDELTHAEERDQLRFAWVKVRTDLLINFRSMPLDLSQAKKLGEEINKILFNYPAGTVSFSDISFALAAYDFLEITDSMSDVSIPNQNLTLAATTELQPLVDEAFAEIESITKTLQEALDYTKDLKGEVL